MATTQNKYTGNGSTTTYAFTFPYIEESDVKVQLDGVDQTTGFSLDTTNIVFDSAPGNNVAIRIFRDTGVEKAAATFFSGSAIRAQDLNDNVNQTLYLNQELRNRTAQTTGSTITGDYVFVDANIQFEGATDDAHETTLSVVDPTADQTYRLPNHSAGTYNIITSGDTNTVTSTMVDGSLVNANIAANAEIAVSKLGDGAARQVLQTSANGNDVEWTDNVDLPGTLDVTGAVTFDGTVTAGTFTGNLSGNANTSTTLQTARNIGGVSFDGSANIDLPGVTTAGNQNTSGNAATATALANARTIAGQSFDGTANITIAPTDLTSVTANATEINQLDGVDLIPSSPSWTSATQIPSNAQISDRIAELGGFEAIADEDSFPATAPPAGVVISIANAGGMVIGASASTTDATRAGGSDPVTIQNIPTNMQNQTIQDGLGMLVIATSTAHTYDFHRVVATNTDVIQLSDDINDFNNRYRVGSTNPTSNNDSGDLFFNTGSEKMLVWDGSSWDEVQSIGQFFVIPDSELADFASGSASTEVISNAPANASQIILSINGVIQQPNTGSTAPSNGFALDGSTIRLAATPPANSTVFGVIIGSSVNVGTPSAGTVDTLQLADDGVTYAKMQDIATANRVLGRASAGEIQEVQVATDMIADDAVTYAKMQHTANANRVLGAAAAGAIGETQVNEAMLNVTNAPTTGQFLQCNNVASGTGDLTWAAVPAPAINNADHHDSNGTQTDYAIDANHTVHSILVIVNGLIMRPSHGGTTRDYTVVDVGGTNTLRFETGQIPANNAEIDIRYLPI